MGFTYNKKRGGLDSAKKERENERTMHVMEHEIKKEKQVRCVFLRRKKSYYTRKKKFNLPGLMSLAL